MVAALVASLSFAHAYGIRRLAAGDGHLWLSPAATRRSPPPTRGMVIAPATSRYGLFFSPAIGRLLRRPAGRLASAEIENSFDPTSGGDHPEDWPRATRRRREAGPEVGLIIAAPAAVALALAFGGSGDWAWSDPVRRRHRSSRFSSRGGGMIAAPRPSRKALVYVARNRIGYLDRMVGSGQALRRILSQCAGWWLSLPGGRPVGPGCRNCMRVLIKERCQPDTRSAGPGVALAIALGRDRREPGRLRLYESSQ